MSLAENIRLARTSKSISQRELAEQAHVTPAYVALLETGDRHNPSLDVLRNIARALDVPIEKLINDPAGINTS